MKNYYYVMFQSLLHGPSHTAFFDTKEAAWELYDKAQTRLMEYAGKELCVIPFYYTDDLGVSSTFNLVNYNIVLCDEITAAIARKKGEEVRDAVTAEYGGKGKIGI